jgi:hypothetical protein
VHDGHQRREQISTGQQQQPARAEGGELGIQQDRGDQVVDRKRRLIARHECPDDWQLQARERRRGEEDHDRDGHDGGREPPVEPAGRQGQEEAALFHRV